MKRLLLLLIPLLLVIGCTDTSDLEARLAALEAENTALKEQAVKPDQLVNVRLKCDQGLDDACVIYYSTGQPKSYRTGTHYELTVKTGQGDTYLIELDLTAGMVIPAIGDTWPPEK